MDGADRLGTLIRIAAWNSRKIKPLCRRTNGGAQGFLLSTRRPSLRGALGLVITTVALWTLGLVTGMAVYRPLVAAPGIVPDTLPPVYHSQRLQSVQPSITVVGTITMTPARQRDGDVTFEVQSGSQRYHAEIVCVYPPTFAAARVACAGYTNRIAIPHRGDRVRITGPLVRDLRHDESFHELEIHPVTALVIL